MPSIDQQSEPHATPGLPDAALTPMLVRRLTSSFGIPPEDAAAIVLEARLAATLAAAAVNDPEGWLLVMVCAAARTYWRHALPADATAAEAEAVQAVDFTGAALQALAPRAREALRLRLHAGKSYPEIAAELDVSFTYARRLVEGALAKLPRSAERSS